MENKEPGETQIGWTKENTIELIRKLRNDLAKDFLDERYLVEYLASTYHKKELSSVKVQFVKKELKELLISPVDLDHYSSLIDEVEDSHATSISYKNESLFYKEIDKILMKYIF